jgi:hypothetical protein
MRENKYHEMEKGNGKSKKETLNFSLEVYSNTTWEVGEWESFLDSRFISITLQLKQECFVKSKKQMFLHLKADTNTPRSIVALHSLPAFSEPFALSP